MRRGRNCWRCTSRQAQGLVAAWGARMRGCAFCPDDDLAGLGVPCCARRLQMADLESTADEVVQLESRAEAAENERDEAAARLRVSTPRPQQNWDALLELVGKQGEGGVGRRGDVVGRWRQDAPVHCGPSATPGATTLSAGCCRRGAVPGRPGCPQAVAHRRPRLAAGRQHAACARGRAQERCRRSRAGRPAGWACCRIWHRRCRRGCPLQRQPLAGPRGAGTGLPAGGCGAGAAHPRCHQAGGQCRAGASKGAAASSGAMVP